MRRVDEGVSRSRGFASSVASLAFVLAIVFTGMNVGMAQDSRTALPEGKHPIPPFRIVGNIYYVGLDDNTSYLIASPQGHILLDMTYESGVPHIRKNIESLGFNVKDIKYLLNAHAHTDHIGGLAAFKELTGGRVLAMAEEAPSIASGGRTDFRRKDDKEQWRPVQVDEMLKDQQAVSLGGNVLVANLTAGHTKGCTTWTTVAEEAGRKYNVVFLCSVGLSGIGVASGVPILNNPKYPTMAEDFAKSFKLLRSLPVDVFLASHGRVFGMAEKIQRAEKGGGVQVWVDPEGYRAHLDIAEKAYLAELEKERSSAR